MNLAGGIFLSSTIKKQLQEVEQLIIHGKFQEALNLFEEIAKKKGVGKEEQLAYMILKSEILSNGLENAYPSGLVVTGGSAMLDGIAEIIESVFAVPVRLGIPREIRGLKDVVKNPAFSTAVGLVIFGSKNGSKKQLNTGENSGFNFGG